MISPELLRRFPFFGFLDETQLKAVAMVADEQTVLPDTTLYEIDQPADALYLLVNGSVDLHFKVLDRDDPRIVKDFFISELNPGDVFGLSAVLEPFKRTMTARVTASSTVLRVESSGLRALCELDLRLAAGLMKAVAMTAHDRLHDTRVQLAAARA